MKLIYSLFLLGLTGCVALVPEQPKVDPTKKQIETQRAEMEKNLKIDNSYKIDGRYIYFYSPEKKLVKNIDVLTRNEFYFDSDEKLVDKTYHPKKEVKRLSSGIPFQENENYYNSLALLTRSEVWMYGIYNNSVVYTYDELLRRSKEVYMDANDNIYTTKHYSYKDSFYIDKISTYDRGNKLVEEIKYEYNHGKVLKVIFRDGNKKIKKEEIYKYDGNKLVEKSYGSIIEKNTYNGDLLIKIEEFEDGALKTYHTLSYDQSGRATKKESFSKEGKLTTAIEYRY